MRKKMYLLVALVLSLVFCLAQAALASEEMGTLVKVNTNAQWLQGTMSGVVFNTTNNNELVLGRGTSGYNTSGTFTSPIYPLSQFNRLVPSWVAITPAGSSVAIDVQVRVNNIWTMWYPLGSWDTNYLSASSTGSDTYGYTSIDTIIVRSGYLADAFRFRVTLKTKDSTVTPTLRQVAVTAFNINVPPTQTITVQPGYLTSLNVPMRSQMIENKKVAGSICSPTSVSMVLEYWGFNRTTQQIYSLVFDNGAKIYGNWPFNTAVAGSFGLDAYVDYLFSMDEVKNKIAAGIPVVCSIAFSTGQLEGSPISSTSGHLVVVRGFVIRNGQEYAIVNDPAAPDNSSVYREYKIEQFDNAWTGWAYIIKPRQ